MRVPSSVLRSGPAVLRPFEGQSAKGAKVYADPVRVPRCRVEMKRKMVRLAGGQTVTAEATAIVQPNVVVKPEDLFTWRTRAWEVYAVNTLEGLSSPFGLELVLGGPR